MKEYAVKIMSVPDQEYFDIAMKEFKLLEALEHRNVIKVYDIFFNELREKIYIIMEYAGHGCNLTAFIEQHLKREEEGLDDCYIPEDKIRNIVRQLLQGLVYLHSKLVCHRDIKPGNIYVADDLA
jgi:serine/threonine protein kinase